jgi:hypothetical protein
MKRAFSLLAVVFVLTVLTAQAADSTKVSGWISDSMCGVKHTTASAADKACVSKCVQGGMAAVFVDSDKQIWAIDNPDAVKGYLGDHVQVTATEDAANKSVHIDAIAAAQ